MNPSKDIPLGFEVDGLILEADGLTIKMCSRYSLCDVMKIATPSGMSGSACGSLSSIHCQISMY